MSFSSNDEIKFNDPAIAVANPVSGSNSWIGAAAQVANGLIGYFSQQETNAVNRAIANENIDYQKWANERNYLLTQQSWARDDNAIQRRVKDAIAAGINPLHVLGAAGNSSPVSFSAPQNRYTHQSPMSNLAKFADAITMSQDFAIKENEIKNLQADNILKNDQSKINRLTLLRDTILTLADAYNVGSFGTTNPDKITKLVGSIGNVIENVFGGGLKQTVEDLLKDYFRIDNSGTNSGVSQNQPVSNNVLDSSDKFRNYVDSVTNKYKGGRFR